MDEEYAKGSKRHFTSPAALAKSLADCSFQLYLCIGVSALFQCLNGYRGASGGPISNDKRYQAMFDIDPDQVTPMTHFFRAAGRIGGVIGLIIAPAACDLLGISIPTSALVRRYVP